MANCPSCDEELKWDWANGCFCLHDGIPLEMDKGTTARCICGLNIAVFEEVHDEKIARTCEEFKDINWKDTEHSIND